LYGTRWQVGVVTQPRSGRSANAAEAVIGNPRWATRNCMGNYASSHFMSASRASDTKSRPNRQLRAL
jgi:hypothetical protein